MELARPTTRLIKGRLFLIISTARRQLVGIRVCIASNLITSITRQYEYEGGGRQYTVDDANHHGLVIFQDFMEFLYIAKRD